MKYRKGPISIIIDTNILHQEYGNSANFIDFRFNKLFENIVEKVEELDLASEVKICVPEIVWREMERKKKEAYKTKLKEITRIQNDYKLPNVEIVISDFDYEDHLAKSIQVYKEKLTKYSVVVESLTGASTSRFSSIVDRAINKVPPFEGVDGKSDKGFKDALIWESILEYKSNNRDVQVILYTRDGLFNDILKKEFEDLYTDTLKAFKSESDLFNELYNISLRLRKGVVTDTKIRDLTIQLKTQVIDPDIVTKILAEAEIPFPGSEGLFDFSCVENIKLNSIIDSSDGMDDGIYKLICDLTGDIVFSKIGEKDFKYEHTQITMLVKADKNSLFHVESIKLLGYDASGISIRIGGELDEA